MKDGTQSLEQNTPIQIEAQDLVVFSPEGKQLAGPLSFSLKPIKALRLLAQVAQVKPVWLIPFLALCHTRAV